MRRSEDIVLLVTTYSRMEKYLPLIEHVIDRAWPGHPVRYFLSDSGRTGSSDRDGLLRFKESNWTTLLTKGLDYISRHHPKAKYVFHLLDDHCPLRHCDESIIEAYLDVVRNNDLCSVAFPTYEWPWQTTDDTVYPDGLIRTWPEIRVRVFNGREMAIVPRDFFRYFQVQPTIWKIDYLADACKAAIREGRNDAWAFEAMQWSAAQQHWIAAYNWPSVHHGFVVHGRVNTAALEYIDQTIAGELHDELLRDSIGLASPALYRAMRISKRLINSTLKAFR